MKIKKFLKLMQYPETDFSYQKIKKLIENGYLSKNYDIDIEHFDEHNFWETLYSAAIDEAKDDQLIYYKDCGNFICSNDCPTDFSEAIEHGCKDITSIANFYHYEFKVSQAEKYINDFIEDVIENIKTFKKEYEIRLDEFIEIQNKLDSKSSDIPKEIFNLVKDNQYLIYNVEPLTSEITVYDVVSFEEIDKGIVWFGPIHYNDQNSSIEDEDAGPSIHSNLNDLAESIYSELNFSAEDAYAFSKIIENSAAEYCKKNNIQLSNSKEREM